MENVDNEHEHTRDQEHEQKNARERGSKEKKDSMPEIEKGHDTAKAAHCNTMQHAATRCNTLQHAATHDTVKASKKPAAIAGGSAKSNCL